MKRALDAVASRLAALGLVPIGARGGTVAVAHQGTIEGQDVQVTLGAREAGGSQAVVLLPRLESEAVPA